MVVEYPCRISQTNFASCIGSVLRSGNLPCIPQDSVLELLSDDTFNCPFQSEIGFVSPSRDLHRKYQHLSNKWHLDHVDRLPLQSHPAAYACELRSCSDPKALLDGKNVHDRILKHGHERSAFLGSLLIQMYVNCGAMEEAQVWFAAMHERNLFSWNFMIAAYARHGQATNAIQLFEQMQLEGMVPDKVTFVHILSAYSDQAATVKGKQTHARIAHSVLISDVTIGTAIVSMYGRCNSLENAWRVFGTMPNRNVVSWNAMLAAYAQHGHGKAALQLFEQMQQEGVIPTRVTFVSLLDACASVAHQVDSMSILTRITCSGFESEVVVATAIVNMFGKRGNLEDARSVFDKIPKRNLISWNAMIAAYAQNGHSKKAYLLFNEMQQEGVFPDKLTFISILSACASQPALIEGKRLHNCIVLNGWESDVNVATAVVNMYAKCGCLESAQWSFDHIPKRDIISWTAMIAAYAQHGHAKAALQLFEQMKQGGVGPDKVTLISLLTACSHAGLVDEGHHCWLSMCQDHGIRSIAEHYDCIIDLLGRAGRLDEAEDLLKRMPFQATALSWRTLLGACRNLVDVNRGEQAANHMLELDPNNPSAYVMLSNIYIESGRENVAEKV